MHCVKSIILQFQQSRRILTSTQVCNKQIKSKLLPYLFQQVNVSGLSAEPEDESENIILEICKDDPETEKKLRILMLEVEVMRQDGRNAPDYVKKDQWEHLLGLTSKNQRNNYLKFLWKTEKSKQNYKAKKEIKKNELKFEEVREFPDDLSYGLSDQSLFLRIRDQSINNFDNYRALQAIRYGYKVIIDCSYEQHMVWREKLNAAKQMTFVIGDNRIHKDPFDIHMCNVDLKGDFMKQMRKNIPTVEEPWFPINIHTESYMDLFPKNNLVYLTPHCREELTTFDPDAIYIIGCMVDKINNEPLSLAKAKKGKIKMAKLPLDRYLEWGPGSKKHLNINHMIPILLDLKSTLDWEVALRHVPRRKLMSTRIEAMQGYMKRKPMVKLPRTYETLKNSHTINSLSMKKKSQRRSLYDDDDI